uniref:Uncharacterized protein n=1 Tax=Musca domestica TaxID=7370 RepID=A0A1I8NBD0_MUSDO
MADPIFACPPDVCMCKWKGGKQTVECGGQSLPNIPEGMDPGTQVLNFSGNALQVLQSERFLRMDLLNLQKIYLSRNQLIRIHEKAFRGLTNLVELDLSENSLQHIPTETFQDYSSLMRLSLSGNPIRELKTAAFRYLSFLTTLELSNCQIERIENEAFVGMDNLEWLRLDGNRISYIQGNHILPKSLHGISLQSNRWTCDCRLLDLHNWLNSYNTPQTEEPKCVEPLRLKGQVIKSLKKEEFACLPEVTPQSTYTEVSEGRNLTIACVVRAIPEPKVLWLFNGQVMTNDSFVDNMHMLYYIDETSTTSEEKHSEIFIYNVGVEDNGTFSCVGQNIAGTTFSNYTIRVIIKEPPVVNEVSFPQNYMNYIVASSAGGGIIFVLIMAFIIVQCKKRQNPVKRKKCPSSAVTTVNGNGNTSSSDGSSSNDTGLMKCSSIINDSDSLNGNSGLILGQCDSLTPTKLAKENGVILGQQMKQNIMLYNPMDSSTQTLQLSVNMAAAASAALSSATPPPPPPSSLMVNPALSSSLAYCSPPSSLRNYTEKNPDLVNDAESGVKHKLKASASLDTAGSEYDSQSDCQNPVQYEQYYQLSAPQFGSQILRPNAAAAMAASSRFGGLTTLPRGMQLKTVMNSIPTHPVDVHLNPVCFLGQDGFAYDYSNAHLQQSPQQPPQQQQQNALHQQQQQQQQNFYRTLPHKHKQQQFANANNNGMRYSLEAEFLQQRSMTPNTYDKYNLPSVRFTAEGYPQTHLVQYPSPPEGYKSCNNGPEQNSAQQQQQQQHQQWPPCLPGYHAQPLHYAPTIMGMLSPQQQQQQHQQQPLTSLNSTVSQLNSNTATSISSSTPSSLATSSLVNANTSIQSPAASSSSSSSASSNSCSSASSSSSSSSSATITNTCPATTTMEGRKRCVAAQADSSTIPECDESEISPSNSSMTVGGEPATTTATEKATTKKRYLNGPLADSPDEGYVGDPRDTTTDM